MIGIASNNPVFYFSRKVFIVIYQHEPAGEKNVRKIYWALLIIILMLIPLLIITSKPESQALDTWFLKWVYTFFIFTFIMSPLGVVGFILFKTLGLFGFRSLFTYEERDSPVHKIDPRTKIIWSMTVGVLVALMGQIWLISLLFFSTIPIWYLSKPSRYRINGVILFLISQFIFIGYSQALFLPANSDSGSNVTTLVWIISKSDFQNRLHPLVGMSLSRITMDGFIYGLQQAMRFITALSVAMIIVTTTAPSDLLMGLKKLFLPLEIAFMIAIAIRTIPLTLEQSMTVLNAERSRGLDFVPKRTRNPYKLAKEVVRAVKGVFVAFVPILISLLRSGRQLALAAEVKAFRSSKKRTDYNQLKMGVVDWLITFTALLLLVGGIIGAVYFGMGASIVG
ncbi:MAG: energy-coupling factor transporter transmembrane component T family protein [Candidatus Odinarchaeota archaeon]